MFNGLTRRPFVHLLKEDLYMKMKSLLAAVIACALVACSPPPIKPILKTFSDKVIDFSDLKGHVVIVNYWADWCEPCKREIPALNEFAKTHKNVWVLGVNFDGVNTQEQQRLIAKNNIHYFNLPDDPSKALGIGDIPAVPVSFVFNRQGELKEKLYGPQSEASLKKAIL